MRRFFIFLAALVVGSLPAGAASAGAKVDFRRDVQPLLAQHCYSCHGDEVQQSGLRLDKRQPAMRGGDYGPVIVAGKASASKLIRRVVDGDGGMRMPPAGALANSDIETLKAWIDQGAEFETDVHPDPPAKPLDPRAAAFISAVRTGSAKDVAKLLAANPALVNAADQNGSTALHHAAGFGSLDTLRLLLDKGADANARNRRKSNPLHWAIPDEAKVRALLAAGASVDAKQADGRTPLYIAASAYSADPIVRLLLEKGANPNAATSNGQTPLMAAAGRGDVEAMRMLLDRGAAIAIQNGAGANALMGAAGARNPEAVRLLLDKGADPNVLTKRNETALANAATAGVEGSVRLLLEHGAKVNVADDRGYTPLMYASASEAMSAGIVKMLLAKGADLKATGEGETSQTLAAKRGDTEVARLVGVSEAERRQRGVAPLPAARERERSIPEAVSLALGLLEKQSHVFIRTAGCNSCHAQDIPSAAAAIARARGIPAPKEIVQISEAMNGETPERMMDGVAPGISSLGWEMFDRFQNRTPPDLYTDATAHFVQSMQNPEGYWKGPDGRRPPLNSGDLQTTAMAIFTLRNFSPALSAHETEASLARAAAWLEKVRPETTQQRAFKVLGLVWANGASSSLERAVRELTASQRTDGGWSQLPDMDSDAYATGQALYALNASGKAGASDPAVRKSVQFLLRAQQDSGSWHVKTRSIWIQPYFDSGFPNGPDQWISAAGTAWASMALSTVADATRVSRK